MLDTLIIRNIAIIDSAEICFKPGLNILSGETGAGKSIVIEAISLLLGSRAKTELIRSGCDEAVIEGLFDISEISWIKPRLKKLGLESNASELLVKRTIHQAGRHRITVNGELVTLSMLQNLCEGLVDLCGQHEHQLLTRPVVQLELLDKMGGLCEQASAVASGFAEYRKLVDERQNLQDHEASLARRADFLKFQRDELRGAALTEGEDEKLHIEKQLLQNAESRSQAAEGVRQMLEDEEGGVLAGLRSGLVKLRTLNQLDPSVAPIREFLERALAEAEEGSISLNRYLSSMEVSSERLQEVQDRLALIADLRRKYGVTVKEMLDTLEKIETEFSDISDSGKKLEELSAAIEQLKLKLSAQGNTLSSARAKAARILSGSVTEELKDLKMGDAKFTVELSTKSTVDEWTGSGGPDGIQFVVQTNRGESGKPLGKIASGGELSRLMLAIRQVIADRGGIGVYLFDEIDAGIGGQVAFQVGKKLKSVSAANQVICITHLPQVASFANHHLIVRKTVRDGRTITEVAPLRHSEQKEELARMLGGPELTKKSLDNAAELLQLAR